MPATAKEKKRAPERRTLLVIDNPDLERARMDER
jgi:hypothetical protein